MKTRRPDPESVCKETVLVLTSNQDELTSLSYLLARSALEPVVFGNEHELANWLRHCVDGSTSVLATVIDAATFERHGYRLDCKSSLVARRIPLLIVDLARQSSDWCRFGGDRQHGLTLYLATGNLLPQLFEQLKRQGGRENSSALGEIHPGKTDHDRNYFAQHGSNAPTDPEQNEQPSNPFHPVSRLPIPRTTVGHPHRGKHILTTRSKESVT